MWQAMGVNSTSSWELPGLSFPLGVESMRCTCGFGIHFKEDAVLPHFPVEFHLAGTMLPLPGE